MKTIYLFLITYVCFNCVNSNPDKKLMIPSQKVIDLSNKIAHNKKPKEKNIKLKNKVYTQLVLSKPEERQNSDSEENCENQTQPILNQTEGNITKKKIEKSIDQESIDSWEKYEILPSNIKSDILPGHFTRCAWSRLNSQQRDEIVKNEKEKMKFSIAFCKVSSVVCFIASLGLEIWSIYRTNSPYNKFYTPSHDYDSIYKFQTKIDCDKFIVDNENIDSTYCLVKHYDKGLSGIISLANGIIILPLLSCTVLKLFCNDCISKYCINTFDKIIRCCLCSRWVGTSNPNKVKKINYYVEDSE